MFSCLFYGSLIWQNNTNLAQLNKFWYKLAKSAVGAVFNVQHAIAEVILGVPPLAVSGRILAVKHYLKALSNTDDIHRDFLLNEVRSRNPVVVSQMKDVMKFIKWKHEFYPRSVSPSDNVILEDGLAMEDLFELTKKTCYYSRRLMDKFTELIWQESIQNQLQLEGWPKNNLLNSFLFRHDGTKWKTPLCSCGVEEQTAIHLLTRCPLVEDVVRDQAGYLLSIGNGISIEGFDDLGLVGTLNCSRDPKFIEVCRMVVCNESLNLTVERK